MGLTANFGGRLLLLLPMAFCLYLILDSQDKSIRLGAVVVLIIVEQIREWMLVNSVKALAGGKKGKQY